MAPCPRIVQIIQPERGASTAGPFPAGGVREWLIMILACVIVVVGGTPELRFIVWNDLALTNLEMIVFVEV